jgi:hypothetical protein
VVRYGFKVERAKGEGFRVGDFSTYDSIANVSCAASLNGIWYSSTIAEAALSASDVAGEACTAVVSFKSALSSTSIFVSSR